jgi:hypothetical protein
MSHQDALLLECELLDAGEHVIAAIAKAVYEEALAKR